MVCTAANGAGFNPIPEAFPAGVAITVSVAGSSVTIAVAVDTGVVAVSVTGTTSAVAVGLMAAVVQQALNTNTLTNTAT